MKKPIIGLVGRFEKKDFDSIFIHDEYRVAILNSGGIPLLLLPPYFEQMKEKTAFYDDITFEYRELMIPLLDYCDGFLFSGGSEWFGYEEFIFQYAYQKNKPVLGICLGMQLMACTPYFHEFNSDKTVPIKSNILHKSTQEYVHEIKIMDSKLKKILGSESIFVNSRHSSCILKNDFFKVSSISEDEVIESIEIPNKKFMIGVQWHPESLFWKDDYAKKIFQAFLESCLDN